MRGKRRICTKVAQHRKRRVSTKRKNLRNSGPHPGHPASHLDALLAPPNPGVEFLTGTEWVTVANMALLTTREIVVATLLLHGRTRKSIAHRLKLSPETVRVHIDRLFEKFRVQDRMGLGLRIARIREVLRTACQENSEDSDQGLVTQRCDVQPCGNGVAMNTIK